MATNIDPTASVFGAFSDIGKRLVSFLVCLFWGFFIGSVSAWVIKLIYGMDHHLLTEEGIEEGILDVDLVSQLPPLGLTVIGLIATAACITGLIRIIKGSTGVIPYLAVALGAGMFSILSSAMLGWEIKWAVWIILIGFLALTYGFIHKWRVFENKKWQEELDAIYAENRIRRATAVEEGSEEEGKPLILNQEEKSDEAETGDDAPEELEPEKDE